MWELLTERSPFDGENIFVVAMQIKNGRRLKIENEWPHQLKRLLKTAWDPDPNERGKAENVFRTLKSLVQEDLFE